MNTKPKGWVVAATMVLTAGLAAWATYGVVAHQLAEEHAIQLAQQQIAWQTEKAILEAQLRDSHARAPLPSSLPQPPQAATAPVQASAKEILDSLLAIRASATHPRIARQLIGYFEDLVRAGPAAFPVIAEFLGRNEEFDYSTVGNGKEFRDGKVPTEFLVPPSLRLGLFEVLKRIGGEPAEQLMAKVLGSTGRGVEVAYLARALQELTPDQYRETALTAARELLTSPPVLSPSSPLDQNHREYLYGVLAFYNDSSFAGQAQNQLVQPDGRLDRSAMKYLQQALGAQAVSIAAQAYQDPRITDPAAREPLARLALSYVGADSQANEFYQSSINDLSLSQSHRKNLIEDLNQDGFVDRKNLTTRDLPLIQNRLALIEQLAPTAADQANAAAFKEAYKDLLKMREQVLRVANPALPPANNGQSTP
jgi:hypothetical protein